MKKPSTDAHFLDLARPHAGELGNHASDEFMAGRLTRRELLRHASMLGIALSAGGLLGMPGARAQGAGKPGGVCARISEPAKASRRTSRNVFIFS